MSNLRIAIMGGWNTDSGASFHSEMIGRAFVELGYKLDVFTFFGSSFHGTNITGKDEDYVERCFTVSGDKIQKLNAVPFITKDYDYFIVEDLGMLPNDLLAKIFHRIKGKAKVINVVHDYELTQNPSFYQFEWDAIIAFDQRYYNFLIKGYDKDKVNIIPYPAHQMKKGDKRAAREKLGIPQDKKIILTFGPAAALIAPLIPTIAKLKEEYPVKLLAVTKNNEALNMINAFKNAELMDIEIREEAPDIDHLYDYLYASDLLLINKSSERIVLSSTIYQCIGSGCPIVALNSTFTELYKESIIKFSDMEELISGIKSVFDQGDKYKTLIKEAENFVTENSSIVIAQKFIDLFKHLK
jgi:hypothetical protein